MTYVLYRQLLIPFSLAAICSVLGYDANLHTHEYLQYVDNYRNRRMPLSKPVGIGTTARSAQCKIVPVI